MSFGGCEPGNSPEPKAYINSKDENIKMMHPKMAMKIGTPAIIEPGGEYPSFNLNFDFSGSVSGEVVFTDNKEVLKKYPKTKFSSEEKINIVFNGRLNNPGLYRIEFIIDPSEKSKTYESFYFRVLNNNLLGRRHSIAVHPDQKGKLIYSPDYKGNRIPDFSTAGYMGGGTELPDVSTEIILEPKAGDDTERIQEAIDNISSMGKDANGMRGAILLKKGVYEVESSLTIDKSGIVIRGEGEGKSPLRIRGFRKGKQKIFLGNDRSSREFNSRNLYLDPSNDYDLDEFKNSLQGRDATIIIATGKDRRELITISGQGGAHKIEGSGSEIMDKYVPVGSRTFHIEKPELFSVGDKIIIERSSNVDWISKIGMDEITGDWEDAPSYSWHPFDLHFEDKIMAIDENKITIEGTILNAIEKRWGGGRIFKYSDEKRIEQVGIEELRGISFWQPDEYGSDHTKHAHQFIHLQNGKNAWIQGVTAEHFTALSGAFKTQKSSKQITIKNCANLVADDKYYSGPGYRNNRVNINTDVEVGRYGFDIKGQSVLVMNCYTLNNRRSFVVGAKVSGPNVFLDCKAEQSLTRSEPHHKWSVGGLYDNVTDDITFMNRLIHGSGHGWAGANYVAWNTQGSLINEQPPTAQNWAIGHQGERRKGQFFDYHEREGYWELYNKEALPRSLYIQQLMDRKTFY